MMRKTYTILAVALTTSACGAAASEAAPDRQPTRDELARELASTPTEDALRNREHFAALCDDSGYPLPGNVNAKGGPPSAIVTFCKAIGPTPPPATPAPQPAAPACEQGALSVELQEGTILSDALVKHAHFRCLCDDQGYPLVGNINATGTTASAFCAALVEKGLL
jgi:hypothetical protein